MRGSLEIPVLGQNVLSFMARYLDAKTGALYVGETDKELHLVSSYALTRRKRDTSRVQVGEGLVGQAALEGKPIVLTEVADDYMTVESAVGATTPCNVLVAPLVMDGLVKGVLELGSLVPFSDRQLEFVDQVAEYIAIAIGSGQDQERLQLLLSESTRQQTELSKANEGRWKSRPSSCVPRKRQLQAQSEELQQTNEELEEKTQYLGTSETLAGSRNAARSRRRGATCRERPRISSRPTATNRSSWPTCRTSCVPPSTAC